ncbi:hypothetical protein OKW22_001357 [Bacilli bacterium PM5-3]|nr:hypothetical protein [Bacilli bacterium PM5-3]
MISKIKSKFRTLLLLSFFMMFAFAFINTPIQAAGELTVNKTVRNVTNPNQPARPNDTLELAFQ